MEKCEERKKKLLSGLIFQGYRYNDTIRWGMKAEEDGVFTSYAAVHTSTLPYVLYNIGTSTLSGAWAAAAAPIRAVLFDLLFVCLYNN